MSRYSDLNEKTYRRHYAKPLPFTTIHSKLIEQCSSPKQERIAKSGKKTEGLDYFYNGSHSKSERGLEWSVLSVIDLKQNTAYPLNASQTKASKSNTRTQQYLEQVQENRDALPSDIEYLVDSRLKYFYTGSQKARGRKRQYSDNVELKTINSPPAHADGFEWVATVDEKIDVYSAWVYSPAFKRGIQVVYLRKVKATGFSTALLFCTDKSCSALDVYRYYKARFQIEFIFRDSSNFWGLHIAKLEMHKS